MKMKNIEIDLRGVLLETPHLFLRSFKVSDLDDLYDYASEEGVGEMAGWKHHDKIDVTAEVLTHFISGRSTFALVDKTRNKVIGSLGIESGSAYRNIVRGINSYKELGFVLAKPYWGMGLMDEALKEAIEYLFKEVGVEALLVAHFNDNLRSKRVIEKSGFKWFYDGSHLDAYGNNKDVKVYFLKNPYLI